MTDKETINKERLIKSIERADAHVSRIEYAVAELESRFPLNELIYGDLSDNEIALIDQLIFRFSKLQDEIGEKSFKYLLYFLQEDIHGLAFKDVLNLLERLNIIESSVSWIELRELRNDLSHEYPTLIAETIEKLNYLHDNYKRLIAILNEIKDIIK